MSDIITKKVVYTFTTSPVDDISWYIA